MLLLGVAFSLGCLCMLGAVFCMIVSQCPCLAQSPDLCAREEARVALSSLAIFALASAELDCIAQPPKSTGRGPDRCGVLSIVSVLVPG
ncbi:hypothetical protein PLICRDRAFT_39013 [Plicaturopsis crispa FD-325 SS-3]|nr:hypothetical protein PLICRDRAFT_39013 [Plicaturopsis crispa FD-325 SS-3]